MPNESLPSANVVGRPYDINGMYANESATSTTHPLFSSDYLTKGTKTSQLYGINYDHPKNLVFTAIQEGSSVTASSSSFEEQTQTMSANLKVSGTYVGFKASVEASYSTSCTSSSKMWHLSETNHVRAYKLSLGALEDLRANLDPTFAADLSGSMSASELIEKYGAHFLYSGVFGGQLIYTQSVSTYEYATESEAKAKVSGNYQSVKVDFSIETSEAKSGSSTQSEGVVTCRGGSTSKLNDGFDKWCSNMENNHSWVLCDFDPDSLLAISVLTTDTARASAIDAAIKAKFAPPAAGKSLKWNGSAAKYVVKGNDSTEKTVTVPQNCVITGIAADVREHAMYKMAIKYLNMDTNEEGWIVSDNKNYNKSDYEMVLEFSTYTGDPDAPVTLPRSAAAVGFSFSVEDNTVRGLRLHYRVLNPGDGAQVPTYLGGELLSAAAPWDKDSFDVDYQPDGKKVLTSIGLEVSENSVYNAVIQEVSLTSVA